jgi:hypothetical protein
MVHSVTRPSLDTEKKFSDLLRSSSCHDVAAQLEFEGKSWKQYITF